MTAKPEPFVSVIIPTFNSGPKLTETLRSALEQPSGLREVIVMDGGSADGTLDTLRHMSTEYSGLIWRSEPDTGIYDAMNKGIDTASGQYLYFLGAGDRLRFNVLERVQSDAPEHGLALVYGDVQIVSSGRLHGGGGPYTQGRLVYDAPCHQSVFYSRGVFEALGRYDTHYKVSADWAFNIKCFGDARIQKIYMNAVIADFEGGGVSANGPDLPFLRDRARLVQEYLGIKTNNNRFFATDQFFAIRIAEAQGKIGRKFWRIQRWALHQTRRPA